MKVFTGRVISSKMSKTATVAVERVVVHPLYKKRFKKIKKYHVHDEFGVKLGTRVKFVASRVYSKTKKWKIVEVVGAEKPGKREIPQGPKKITRMRNKGGAKKKPEKSAKKSV